MILGFSVLNASAAQAACSERRDEYNSRSQCEYDHRYCDYNSRIGCYTPTSESGRCERRNDEYDDRSACERRHDRCEYNSRLGCYVPDERGGGGGGGGGWRPTTTTTTTTTTLPPAPAVCPYTNDDGSYWGRGGRGFRNQQVCEIAERRSCSQGADGCWHP
jgi:hypothetical protein